MCVAPTLIMPSTEAQLVETHAIAAEVAFEHRKIQATKVAHRLYAKLLKFLFGHFAHARQAPNPAVATEVYPPPLVESRRVHPASASLKRVWPEICLAPRQPTLSDSIPGGFAHELRLQHA